MSKLMGILMGVCPLLEEFLEEHVQALFPIHSCNTLENNEECEGLDKNGNDEEDLPNNADGYIGFIDCQPGNHVCYDESIRTNQNRVHEQGNTARIGNKGISGIPKSASNVCCVQTYDSACHIQRGSDQEQEIDFVMAVGYAGSNDAPQNSDDNL